MLSHRSQLIWSSILSMGTRVKSLHKHLLISQILPMDSSLIFSNSPPSQECGWVTGNASLFQDSGDIFINIVRNEGQLSPSPAAVKEDQAAQQRFFPLGLKQEQEVVPGFRAAYQMQCF